MHLLLLPDGCRRRPLDRLESTRQSTPSASPHPPPRKNEALRRLATIIRSPTTTSTGMSRVGRHMGNDDNEALMLMMPTDYPLSCHDPLTPSGCAADVARLRMGYMYSFPMLGLVCMLSCCLGTKQSVGPGLLFDPPPLPPTGAYWKLMAR